MAKHSESRKSREINSDIRYLHHKLSSVDRQIELPPSLTAAALLPLLDKPSARKSASQPIRFAPRILSWKSAATCAAAFALVVGVSAMLMRGLPAVDFVNGTISTHPPAATTPEQPQTSPPPAVSAIDNKLPDEAPAIEESLPTVQPEPENSAAQTAETQQATSTSPAAEETDALGVGGQSHSIVLGADNTYTYSYRANDPSDPAKAGYPITVSIVHNSSGALAFTIDIPDMEQITDYIVSGDVFALIGTTQDSVTLRAYDLMLVGEPLEMDSVTQPGTLLGMQQTGDTVYLFSSAQQDPGVATTALPEGNGDLFCVVTAVDITSMQRSCVAFSGADASLQLQQAGQPSLIYADGQQNAALSLDGLNVLLA